MPPFFPREEREGHIKGKQARCVLFLAYPIISMFLTLKEHESEINILKTLPAPSGDHILHRKRKKISVKACCTLCFSLLFLIVACQIVRYDLSEIAGKSQSRLLHITALLCQTVRYTSQGFGHD